MFKNPISVIIADDHSVVMEGVRAVLKSDPRFNFKGTFQSSKSVIEFLNKNQVDIIILDIDMPDTKNLSHLKEIKTKFPDTKVIIFTMHDSSSYFLKAKSLGADSYLLKTESITFIPTVLIKAIKGEFYSSDELKSLLNENTTKPKMKSIELKIIKLLARGFHYSDIALKIQKSEKTVEYHIYKLRKKFSVTSNVELLLKLSQEMIIQEDE